jgi:hypothetical protein
MQQTIATDNGHMTTTAVSTPTDGNWNEANKCIESHRLALRFGRRMILGLGFTARTRVLLGHLGSGSRTPISLFSRRSMLEI